MSEPFIGQIFTTPYNFTPRGFAACNGQLMNLAQNTALFSLLATQFGGDGITTFALPNLNGRVVIGAYGGGVDTKTTHYELGEFGGQESVTLLTSNLPLHNHTVTGKASGSTTVAISTPISLDASLSGTLAVRDQGATQSSPATAAGAQAVTFGKSSPGTVSIYVASNLGNAVQLSGVSVSGKVNGTLNASPSVNLDVPLSGTTGGTGSSNPVDVRMPFLALNQIIAVTGVFPSRT